MKPLSPFQHRLGGVLFLLLAFFAPRLAKSQDVQMDTLCWVTIDDSTQSLISPESPPEFYSEELQNIFSNYSVKSFEKALPGAINPALQKVYQIICECDINELILDLQSHFPEQMSKFKTFDYQNVEMYDPPDWLWYNYKTAPTTDFWHLSKIEADKAWDITHGNPNLGIASLDTDFDIAHPDLVGKIDPPYDPYSLDSYPLQPVASMNGHGTAAVSMIAAETAEVGQTANGAMVSVGFNSKVMCYQAWAGSYLQRAHHASLVMGARIITSSAGGWSSCPDATGYEQMIVKEILDNGTTIIMPAGNGPSGTHNFCAAVDPVNETPFFPLHPYYDSRIIIVTGSDKNDKFHYIHPGTGLDRTHTASPYVDICAPGHEVFVAMPRQGGFASWPYYWDGQGTSFATPLVAGCAALILDVNPCLSPAEVESIIKLTADPISDAASYPGLIGSGRINVYKAVLMAQNWGNTTFTVSGSQDITFNSIRSYKNIVIKAGGILRVSNTELIMAKDGKIVIEPGGRLYVTNSTIRAKEPRTWCVEQPYKWQGILVEGDPTKDQNPVSNQGYLVLSNSTIQDANNAISTTSQNANGTLNWSKTGGGIIIANTTNFKNNGRHVEFMSYRRTNNASNVSVFTACYFELDGSTFIGNYNPGSPNTYGTNFGRTMVTAWDVKGVRFNGCTFKNINPSPNATLAGYDRGTGILSHDASLIVQDQMNSMNCTSIKRGSFTDLSKGIFAFFSPSVAHSLNVKKQDFVRNDKGVWLKNGLGSNIYKNSFDLNVTSNYYNRLKSNNDQHYRTGIIGILSVGASGFKIEENSFSLAGRVNNQVVAGSIFDNSDANGGGGTFRVNNINGANIGTQTQFNNQNLDISCNTYSGVFSALEMNPISFTTLNTPSFGNCASTVTRIDYNNQFINNTNDGRHHPSPTKIYAIRAGTNKPSQSKTLRMTISTCTNPVATLKSCALTNAFQDPCSQVGTVNPNDFKMKVVDMKLGKAGAVQKLSDGASPALIDVIQQGPNIPANDLHSVLMQFSPNLSDEALISILQYSTHLDETQLVEILVANSALTQDVLDAVEAFGLSSAAKDEVDEAQQIIPSGRDITVSEYEYYSREVINARNDVVWAYEMLALEDSVIDYSDSILFFLDENEDEPGVRQQLVAGYFAVGNIDAAQSTLNNIEVAENDEETETFKTYYQLLISAKNEGRNIYELNTEEWNIMADLAYYNTSAAEAAKGLMSLVKDQHFDAYIERINESEVAAKNDPTTGIEETQSAASIQAYPNPASHNLQVSYKLKKYSNDITVRIIDMSGKEMLSQKSRNIHATLSFNVENLAAGMYFVQLLADDQLAGVQKVIIKR